MFDPIDGTTNYAHGLPIFCCVAGARESTASRSSRPSTIRTASELFTAERGQGAWLNGTPLRVSAAATLIDSLLVTGFHYDVQQRSRRA